MVLCAHHPGREKNRRAEKSEIKSRSGDRGKAKI